MNVYDGISLQVIWFDQDVIEVVFACSNGCFAGSAYIYLSHDDLSGLVETLQGFPAHDADTRGTELGTLNPEFAGGGVRMNFYCRNARGSCVVEVKLRTGACKELGEVESVALKIPIEAAGVDSFLKQVAKMTIAIGTGAALPMVSDFS